MKYILVITFLLALSACIHTEEPMRSQVANNVELLTGFQAQQYAEIFFSGQPPLSGFSKLQNDGFVTIINLRHSHEGKYSADQEAFAARKAGLNYVHIPSNAENILTDEHITKISEALVEHRRKGKVLIHCSSGNRAALWAGGHFFKDHGFSRTQALDIARSLGLTNPQLEINLKDYLKSSRLEEDN